MLETIRKYAHNPVFKIIFGLLVLSFAISGISSMSFSGKEDYVAKVGEKRITQADVEERYRQMLISYGPDVLQMKDEQLRALGISRDNVLKSLIQSALISEEVKDIGIAIGEESIKNQVSKMPVFADDKGKFSAEKFKLFLEKMQISEGRFTADMKTDIQNLILASAVMNNTPKNIFVARQIAGAVKVRRDLDLIEIPADHVKISTNPSDDELGKFYFENS